MNITNPGFLIGIFFYLSLMNFQIDKEDNFTIIKLLADKLDVHTAPLLKSEVVVVAGTGEKNILLDLTNCKYCDSAGLNAIITANRLCKNSDGVMLVSGVQEKVEHLLTISQLDKTLNINYNIKLSKEAILALIK